MFEMLLKSMGGLEGVAAMMARSAGLTPETAQAHIDQIKNMLQTLVHRAAEIERKIDLISVSLETPLQGIENGQCTTDRSPGPDDRDPDRSPGPDDRDPDPGCPCCNGHVDCGGCPCCATCAGRCAFAGCRSDVAISTIA
jgi:hypothetical protein